MKIKQKDNWLGHKMENISEDDLLVLFTEIESFRRTGILKGEKLRNLEREFSENVSHTRIGECMRLIEDEILFEISRRFYNQRIEATSNYLDLKQDDDIYYVDRENGLIEHGKVYIVTFKNKRVDTFSVNFDDGTFDVFDGIGLGKCFFTNEHNARDTLISGE